MNDPIKYYENIAASTPSLKRQEEFELIKKFKENKSIEIKDRIIKSYLKTVTSLSKRYCNQNSLDRLDIIHAGIVGISNALEKFDIAKYTSVNENSSSLFSYYCYRAILMEFKDYYRGNIRQFSVSDTSNTRLNDINKIYKTGALNSLSESESIDLIVQKLGLKKKEVKLLLNLFKSPVELDRTVDLDEDSSAGEIKDLLSMNPDRKDVLLNSSFDHTPVSHMEEKEKYQNLLNGLDEIPERDRAMIYYRYGINCEKQTLSGLSKKYNISPTKVISKLNQIEKKLKTIIESKK